MLVDVEHFRIERLQFDQGSSLEMESRNVPIAVMVLSGNAKMKHGDEDMAIAKGQTLLLPASRSSCHVTDAAELELLAVTLQAG